MNLQALALLAKLNGKTVADLSPEIINDVLAALDLNIPDLGRRAILDMAASTDPTHSLVEWAKERLEDGSFARFVQNQDDSFFARCPHCQQPFVINLKELTE